MALSRLRRVIETAVFHFEEDKIQDGIQLIKDIHKVEKVNTRIPSAYNLFIRDSLNEIKDAQVNNMDRMKMISHKWKTLSADNRSYYMQMRKTLIDKKKDEMESLRSQITNQNLIGKRFYKKRGINEEKRDKKKNSPKIKTTPVKIDVQKMIKKDTLLERQNKNTNVEQEKIDKNVESNENETNAEVKDKKKQKVKKKKNKNDDSQSVVSTGPGEPVIIPKINIYSDEEDENDIIEDLEPENFVPIQSDSDSNDESD